MNTQTEYTCKLTPSQWSLYHFEPEEIEEGSPDPAKVATRLNMHLTHKVREAKRRLKADDCLCEKKLAAKIRDEMYKLMDEHSDAGACDTEPQCSLVAALEQAFKLDPYSLDR